VKHGVCWGQRVEGVLEIKLHDPKRRNAINIDGYLHLAMLVDLAQSDSAVRVIFVHGGKFFTSGNNMTDKLDSRIMEQGEYFYHTMSALNQYGVASVVKAFKDSVKPIVGLVRGWSVGIGFTLASFFTFLYCTPDAKFLAPFSVATLVPEGASTLMFPKIFGRKANELLLMSTPLTAQEAKRYNFVNEVLTNLDEEGEWPDMGKIPTIVQLLQTDQRTLENCMSLINAARNND